MTASRYAHLPFLTLNKLTFPIVQVKLIDFGNAVQDDLSLPPTEHFHDMEWFGGTTVYMPPECFRHNAILYAPVDVWSLGILLIELFTCTLPFYNRDDVLTSNSHLSEDWHKGLSEDVLHLISETCLVTDIARRGAIEDVRRHPWLVGWRGVGGLMEVVKDISKTEKKN